MHSAFHEPVRVAPVPERRLDRRQRRRGPRPAARRDAPKPATTQPSNTGTKPVTSATSLSDIAPRPIAVDPCKAKHPPAYCSKH